MLPRGFFSRSLALPSLFDRLTHASYCVLPAGSGSCICEALPLTRKLADVLHCV